MGLLVIGFRVYPRVCGGTGRLLVLLGGLEGLSPRVRGNPHQRPPVGLQIGSIPACAGEPSRACSRSRNQRVYPRVCGGTFYLARISRYARGLSPRVRGNPPARRCGIPFPRSIPACAGEPGTTPRNTARPGVYPRVCGGTSRTRPPQPLDGGLSPRVRGNPAAAACHTRRRRSIPACAGEPPRCRAHPRGHPVYPRVCGGTVRRGIKDSVLARSIPACAGEPTGLHFRFGHSQVYPRVCGGTDGRYWVYGMYMGLSPRVRGNPHLMLTATMQLRSIPACAGEPAVAATIAARETVYPRVCGGTIFRAWQCQCIIGLSPRVRGNHSEYLSTSRNIGSIPACAGEPTPGPTWPTPNPVYPRVCGGTDAQHCSG